MKSFKSIFPYNQNSIAEYQVMSDEEIDAVLDLSENVFYSWRNKSFGERASVFTSLAHLLK